MWLIRRFIHLLLSLLSAYTACQHWVATKKIYHDEKMHRIKPGDIFLEMDKKNIAESWCEIKAECMRYI